MAKKFKTGEYFAQLYCQANHIRYTDCHTRFCLGSIYPYIKVNWENIKKGKTVSGSIQLSDEEFYEFLSKEILKRRKNDNIRRV